MRGASALDRALATSPDPELRVYVVWMPVVPGDHVPFAAKKRALQDPRVTAWYDPRHAVATRLLEHARAHPEWFRSEEERQYVADRGAILWDVLFVWPPGATWSELPAPTYRAYPVVTAEPELPSQLDQARAVPGR